MTKKIVAIVETYRKGRVIDTAAPTPEATLGESDREKAYRAGQRLADSLA